MTEQTTPKRRGRPTTGKALSPAERMARTRLKAREAMSATHPDLTDVSDTGLFEALRVSYKRGLTWDMALVVEELYRRVNPRAATGQSLEVTFTATVAAPDAGEDARVTTLEPETVADNRSTDAGTDSPTVSENSDAVTETTTSTTKPPRAYPTDIKRLAVELADQGKPTAEIRAAILAEHGKAPDISNLARLVRQWREALDGEASPERNKR